MMLWTDRQVLAFVNSPAPEAVLTASRLRLLGSVGHQGPTVALALAITTWRSAASRPGVRTWMDEIFDDLRWLRSHVEAFKSFVDPADNFEPWDEVLSRPQAVWKRYVWVALLNSARYEKRVSEARDAATIFFQEVCPVGVPRPVVSLPDSVLYEPLAPATVFECPWCAETFTKSRALRVHISMTHR